MAQLLLLDNNLPCQTKLLALTQPTIITSPHIPYKLQVESSCFLSSAKTNTVFLSQHYTHACLILYIMGGSSSGPPSTPALSASTRAFLSTILTIFFLMLMSYFDSSPTSTSPLLNTQGLLVQNYQQRGLKAYSYNTPSECIDIRACPDKCLCAKLNSNSTFEHCRNDAGFINYLEFHYCYLSNLAPLSFAIMVCPTLDSLQSD